eukprot:3939925-Pyramimonas_sp.AAC.1
MCRNGCARRMRAAPRAKGAQTWAFLTRAGCAAGTFGGAPYGAAKRARQRSATPGRPEGRANLKLGGETWPAPPAPGQMRE